jgi:release factor glutamine methyltransferase
MRLKAALDSAIATLAARDVGSPRMNAETLLIYALNCDRAHLYAHPERELTPAEQERFEEAIAERAAGKPAQYITGHQEFWGLDFIVTPAVLIPRPETEHAVEVVLELARNSAAQPEWEIADVGTGSGCIALALAHELPRSHIYATDISEEALAIARINAERLDLRAHVEFHHENLLSGLAQNREFDCVVSNPPYVSESRPELVQRQVRDYEPRVAVFSGATGMEAYRRLIPQALSCLKPGGWLVLEIGYSQEAEVRALLQSAAWSEVRVHPDLQGIPRVLAAHASVEPYSLLVRT